jgi:hypothetical protein
VALLQAENEEWDSSFGEDEDEERDQQPVTAVSATEMKLTCTRSPHLRKMCTPPDGHAVTKHLPPRLRSLELAPCHGCTRREVQRALDTTARVLHMRVLEFEMVMDHVLPDAVDLSPLARARSLRELHVRPSSTAHARQLRLVSQLQMLDCCELPLHMLFALPHSLLRL